MLRPDAIARMVGRDGLEPAHERTKSVRQEGELLLQRVVDAAAAVEARHVLEARAGPVVDDEEGEQGCAHGIEPPDPGRVADEREEQRERVEDDVGLAVLGEGLHLRRLDADAAEPDEAL